MVAYGSHKIYYLGIITKIPNTIRVPKLCSFWCKYVAFIQFSSRFFSTPLINELCKTRKMDAKWFRRKMSASAQKNRLRTSWLVNIRMDGMSSSGNLSTPSWVVLQHGEALFVLNEHRDNLFRTPVWLLPLASRSSIHVEHLHEDVQSMWMSSFTE